VSPLDATFSQARGFSLCPALTLVHMTTGGVG
jgi:hypothetical protein